MSSRGVRSFDAFPRGVLSGIYGHMEERRWRGVCQQAAGFSGRAAGWVVAAALAMMSAVAGCGSAAPAAGPIEFPAEPFATLTTTSGRYQVTVRTSPQPPVKGVDAVQYQITDAAGGAVDGLVLDAVPWMPSHGHGTSANTIVVAQGQGLYEIDNVYLFMNGHWELRSTFAASDTDGADGVTPVFDVP